MPKAIGALLPGFESVTRVDNRFSGRNGPQLACYNIVGDCGSLSQPKSGRKEDSPQDPIYFLACR